MEHKEIQEGSPWFWKLFGPAIIGLAGILLMFSFNSINTNVFETKQEFKSHLEEVKKSIADSKVVIFNEVSKIRDEVGLLKAKLAALEEFREGSKDKLASMDSSIKERATYSESNVSLLRDKDKEHNMLVVELRERIVKLEEQLSKLEGSK